MRTPRCVSVWPPIVFWMPRPIFMKICMYEYNMAREPISTADFINPSYPSVFLYCVLSLLGNGSVKHYRGNEYTRNKIIFGLTVFYISERIFTYVWWGDRLRLGFKAKAPVPERPSRVLVSAWICNEPIVASAMIGFSRWISKGLPLNLTWDSLPLLYTARFFCFSIYWKMLLFFNL
jgi:hypothetical protein